MDFAVKIVILFLFAGEVFGRSIKSESENGNDTELNTTISIAKDGSCELNGIFYSLNSVFDVPSNPCLVCECNENWTGVISNTSCYNQICDEIADRTQDGCIPVYDESKCCVIDYYCRDNIIPDATAESEIESDNATEEDDDVVCPTPICADESCRIEVPPGQMCPTCICEGFKEKNDFEPEHEESERHPFSAAQNTTEDMEFFLIPVPWKGVEGVENFEDEEDASNDGENSEGDTNGIFREDSSLNAIIESASSKRTEPRRKRSTNSQTGNHQLNRQQQWSVLQEEDETSTNDDRERENFEDSGEDYGEMKIFGRKESQTEESIDNEITELYEEESVIWGDTIVPGCPTPLCEHSGCRIGIPPGHKCPTCICNRRIRQP